MSHLVLFTSFLLAYAGQRLGADQLGLPRGAKRSASEPALLGGHDLVPGSRLGKVSVPVGWPF